MKPTKIDLNTARKYIFQAQYLNNNQTQTKKAGILEIINQLGYIQIDTISVIQRAHHHTLWTRQDDYKPEIISQLQTEEKAIFEYWGHAASYLPIRDYRFYLPKMKNFADCRNKWIKDQTEKYKTYFDPLLEKIYLDGALTSRDIVCKSNEKRGGWWDWKPAKIALELLFWRGDLMISKRINFQKYYDLTERVLPKNIDLNYPSDHEVGVFCVKRALQAHAIASEKEICNNLNAAGKTTIKKALKFLLEEKQVIKIKIAELPEIEYFAQSDLLNKHPQKSDQINILSPFDNLIIQRNRTRDLLGMNYSLECYLPRNKRKFGYFTLPVFSGTKPLIKIDAKADRKQKILVIKNMIREKQGLLNDDTIRRLSLKLLKFSFFNGCYGINIENSNPSDLKVKILTALRKLS